MAASTTQNPAVQSESKSAKKKKAKIETASSVAAAAATSVVEDTSTNPAPESSNGDAGYESPYIKELYKSIRNVNKKISNASKVDNILTENPKLSLDELVAARKINADQRTQIQNKPKLQASLAQLEEQIAQYKKFDQDYKTRSQAEKADFEKTFTEKAGKDLEEAVAAAKAEATATATKEQQSNMLILSQFLRLAAARRAEDAESTLEENVALEGVLVEVYSGDESAVASMIKLISGSPEKTTALTGEKLSVTYAQVKAAAVTYSPPGLPTEGLTEEAYSGIAVETNEYPTQSDPTIANAGMTELEAPSATTAIGHVEEVSSGIPQNSGLGDDAANAAAEKWDPSSADDLSASQEWVQVHVAETDASVTTTPAAAANNKTWAPTTQSWADDQPEEPASTDAPAVNGNDGFHEVQRSRGGRDRDGQFRGRGGRGDNGGYRGRGAYRGGDGSSGYRGRGRGGPRGGAAARGRRPDES